MLTSGSETQKPLPGISSLKAKETLPGVKGPPDDWAKAKAREYRAGFTVHLGGAYQKSMRAARRGQPAARGSVFILGSFPSHRR